ncbi:MAG: XdhC family protein, partial [Nitrospiraceae bacterium]|nr:XdhC family protein [Nitrospiraceae bacterium]
AGFRTAVIDDRQEFANRQNIPSAGEIFVSPFRDSFSACGAGPGDHVVIATRGHLGDMEALRAALGTRAGFIGLVGSRRKRALLIKALLAEGYSEDDAGRVVTPVGIPIGSVTPEEIAVSIMAQIIGLRRKGAIKGVGGAPCCGGLPEDASAQAAFGYIRQTGVKEVP